jgi:hypothetical protein
MPDGHKIDQHLPSQDRPKFTQIVIFGLKTNRLATQGYVPMYVPTSISFLREKLAKICAAFRSKKNHFTICYF